MPGVCTCVATGLKTWPEFKDLHQRTDASGFAVDCDTHFHSGNGFTS